MTPRSPAGPGDQGSPPPGARAGCPRVARPEGSGPRLIYRSHAGEGVRTPLATDSGPGPWLRPLAFRVSIVHGDTKSPGGGRPSARPVPPSPVTSETPRRPESRGEPTGRPREGASVGIGPSEPEPSRHDARAPSAFLRNGRAGAVRRTLAARAWLRGILARSSLAWACGSLDAGHTSRRAPSLRAYSTEVHSVKQVLESRVPTDWFELRFVPPVCRVQVETLERGLL